MTALVLERTLRHEFAPDRWVPQEGDGYTVRNGVYVDCPDCARAVCVSAVRGRYKPEIKCGAKCRTAVGPSCDCECGGANHGCDN